MKKLILKILFVFCITAFFGIYPAFSDEDIDKSNKVIVESLENFTFRDSESTVTLKVLESNEFENGVKFEEGTVLYAKASKMVDPKRGKRNGYLIINPIKYTVPGEETLDITDEYWLANVYGYKPFDMKNAAISAGLFAGGMFVKGIGQVYYFGKGVLSPEDGENRLKSGVKSVYKNSPLAYIESGEELSIKTGDVLLLKFYHSDVPKWRFFKRNK